MALDFAQQEASFGDRKVSLSVRLPFLEVTVDTSRKLHPCRKEGFSKYISLRNRSFNCYLETSILIMLSNLNTQKTTANSLEEAERRETRQWEQVCFRSAFRDESSGTEC